MKRYLIRFNFHYLKAFMLSALLLIYVKVSMSISMIKISVSGEGQISPFQGHLSTSHHPISSKVSNFITLGPSVRETVPKWQ